MSRWLPTTALLGALVLSAVVGCGASATSGPAAGGSSPRGTAGSNSGKGGGDTAKPPSTSKDPGFQPG